MRARLLAAGLAAVAVLGGGTAAVASTSGVVISEFRFRGTNGGNDEFIELVNAGSGPVDVGGWSVWGTNTAGANSQRAAIPARVTLLPGEHYLLTNTAASGYSGASPGDTSYTVGVVDGGGIQLRSATGAVVDAAGFTTALPASFREGAGLLAQLVTNTNRSYERSGGTQDTDVNSADFAIKSPSGPQNWGKTPPPDPLKKISEIQGAGNFSPINGRDVELVAVVTGLDDELGFSTTSGRTFTDDRGLFVEEEPADWDTDPLTSEGIFVGDVFRPQDFPAGTVVRIKGTVAEKFGLTQVNADRRPEVVGTAPVPAPVTIDPAAAQAQGAARAYYESLEGMLVRLTTGVANAGGTNKFGELFLTPGTTRDRVFRTDTVPALIGTDADAGAGNPPIPPRDPDGSTTTVRADLFDRVDDVVGPLVFAFENYRIVIQPGAMPTVTKGPTVFPYGDTAPLGAYQIRVASFNVENFFPAGGDLDGGAVTEVEYAEKKARIAEAIDGLLLRPDVVAVQEVVDAEILNALASDLGGYTAYLIDGNDSRGIDVGYLVKDTVTASNVHQFGKDATTSLTDCADGTIAGVPLLFDRPPLAIDVEAGAASFTILNNHFASKSHPDACRAAQGAFVRDRVSEIEHAGGNAIVLGDLNSFEDEVALTTLEDGTTSLDNLWDTAPAEERYSFAFQGRLQTLDHVLVTNGLDVRVSSFQYTHFDNDYYERTPADGHHVSDHDPPAVVISTDACLSGDDRSTVFVGDADTGVANRDSGDGCTIGDLIREDVEYRNHGQWVSHVATLTGALIEHGLLSGNEKGAIQRVAANYTP